MLWQPNATFLSKECNSGLDSKDDQNVAGHCILWGEHSQLLLRSVNLFAANLVASLESWKLMMSKFPAAKVPKILTVTSKGIAIFIPLLKDSCQSRSRAWSLGWQDCGLRLRIDNDVNRASYGEVFVPDVSNHNLTFWQLYQVTIDHYHKRNQQLYCNGAELQPTCWNFLSNSESAEWASFLLNLYQLTAHTQTLKSDAELIRMI